ncbi:hypothetical protein MP638_006524 [Amoeboaphelidium occidentale]|nr:hypothetical protein MP638_006524 [Amoeboaphelidium occidentale]
MSTSQVSTSDFDEVQNDQAVDDMDSGPSQLPRKKRPSWRLSKPNEPFALKKSFVEKYASVSPPFGFGGLGKVVYLRTYSRTKDDGQKEQWHETVERVVNGTYNMQKRWIDQHSLGWDRKIAQDSAQKMFDKIFHMKFLPPGRGLWAMGSPLTEERGIYAALNNCAFVSTADMWDPAGGKTPSKPFTFLMDASMLGVGVGFDTKGASGDTRSVVFGPRDNLKPVVYTIPDSREGWVDSLRMLIDSYFLSSPHIEFDYSEVRPSGSPIRGFGGIASGPAPLKELHEKVRHILDTNKGSCLSITSLVDIMNLIGKCVVSGNVRRCLPGDALVHTRRGLVPIRDVKVGLDVMTSSGKYQKVVNWFDQGPREMVKITTEDGYFICTPNHRMPVLTGTDTYVWVEAELLQPSDYLITSRMEIEGRKTRLPAFNSTKAPLQLDDDLAWFIGYLQGSLNAETDVSMEDTITFSFKSSALAEKAKKQLARIDPNVKMSAKDTNDRPFELTLSVDEDVSEYLHDLMHMLKSESVPEFILLAKSSKKWAYVSGFMDIHACSEASSSPIMCHQDEAFVRQVQILLYSCGIEAKLACRDEQSHVFSLYASTERSKRLLNLVRTGSAKLLTLNQDLYDGVDQARLRPCKVVRVEPLDNIMYTYDIQVETDEEFYCDGYLTHNTAEIAFGDPNSAEYVDLKNYEKNPHRADYGWTSNNSVFCSIGMKYDDVCERVALNGEPGFFWLDNARNYGRMADKPDNKDLRASGGNPCLEQTLESYEMCCLVETFPTNHSSLAEFCDTLKYAYLYAKTVTLGATHWPETNRVMLRNRRIGCSMSGIAQFLESRGIEELRQWCERGYETIQNADIECSNWLAIPRSIKTTSIKPSGTVSLLAGATPGLHYPESRYCIRRMRLAKNSELVEPLQKSGFKIEPCVGNEEHTVVVEFPVDFGENMRSLHQVSMWEQLSLASFLQKYWSDNQVSCTVTFDPKAEGPQLKHSLDYFQYQLKGISFLPRLDYGAYPQMPIEAISKEQYDGMVSKLDLSKWTSNSESIRLDESEMKIEKYCDGDKCAL